MVKLRQVVVIAQPAAVELIGEEQINRQFGDDDQNEFGR
jgi:hypothetical protein